jgi:Fe(3+) dicitrate transport protein
MSNRICLFLLLLTGPSAWAQTARLSGLVHNAAGEALAAATVVLEPGRYATLTDAAGALSLDRLPAGEYTLAVKSIGYRELQQAVSLRGDASLDLQLTPSELQIAAVEIQADKTDAFGRKSLRGVENFGIYEGKKSEVIEVASLTANLATNNARQVFGKVPGLNIWESDGAGIQLGIGARGLNPNRSAHLNVRQNGYDISADALGYPESYYTPPVEALERIEFVRGAASLQYGTQFGGMLNFVFKKPPADRRLALRTRQTVGSYGFFGSFNSVSGTSRDGRISYLGLYQRRQGDGWRPNSQFHVNTVYSQTTFRLRPNFALTAEYTYLNYLAQQPGGLTDVQFGGNPRQSVRSRNWFAVGWNLPALAATWDLSRQTRLNVRAFGMVSDRQALGNLERIHVVDLGGERTLIRSDFRNAGVEARLLHDYQRGGLQQTWLTGLRLYRGHTRTRQGNASDGAGPDFRFLHTDDLEGSDYAFDNRNLALFTEHIFRLSPKFSLTPGARFEYIHTGAAGFYKQRTLDYAGNVVADTNFNSRNDRGRSFVLVGLGASYRPGPDVEWYANLSQNYRAINFNDLRVSNPNSYIDENIGDERGFSADLGLRGNWRNRLNFDASLFAMLYRDRIGQVLRADRAPLYQDYRFRTNLGDAYYAGVEAYVEADLLNWNRPLRSAHALMLFVNGSVLDARYFRSEDRAVEGKYVEMAPPVSLRGGLTYSYRKYRLSLQANYVHEHFTDATNARLATGAVNGIIPSYWVSDLSLSCPLPWGLSLEVTCNNLFDQQYFTRRAEAYPGPGIIPSDGRGWFVTVGACF